MHFSLKSAFAVSLENFESAKSALKGDPARLTVYDGNSTIKVSQIVAVVFNAQGSCSNSSTLHLINVDVNVPRQSTSLARHAAHNQKGP